MKIGRWKKLLAILGVFLLIALPAVGEENNSISIQLNGQPLYLTDSNAMLVDGRVFVPFRAVFEGLEAEVNYDAEKNEINASRGERSLSMTIGNSTIKLWLNGVEEAVNTDAPSFIHQGRTYVPVRFAAQALDCKVGWDQARQTVIVVDTAKIKAEKVGYELMDSLENYKESRIDGNRALNGSFSLLTVNSENNDKKLSVILTGISSPQRTALQMKIEPDTMSLAHNLLREYGYLSQEGERLLQTLEKVELDLIIDWSTNQLYAKSELAAVLDEGEADIWYQLDGERYLPVLKQGGNIEKLVDDLLVNLSLTDSAAVMAALDDLKMLQSAYSDKSFEKQGNQYVSKFTEVENGAKLEIMTTLLTENNEINGYISEMSVTEENLLWKYSLQEKGESLSLEMDLETENAFAAVEGKVEYQTTRQNPSELPNKFVRID